MTQKDRVGGGEWPTEKPRFGAQALAPEDSNITEKGGLPEEA